MKKTIMIVLGGGGHTQQLLPLVDKLERKYSLEFVVRKDGRPGKKKLEGKIFRISNPRPMDDAGVIKTILRLFPYTLESIKILSKSKAKTIISCGPAISIPISLIGKILFRKKIIFIESWSRVKSKSFSGKLIGPLADKIFVQWEENKNYKNAIYAGRLG
jgi:UDP-N-acetylglucosamine:LPS N-acetylglucosamine transferase